ncbi:MAG: S1 RNA-binding domain-containing protein [Phycisphaerales bacterium]|nr:S1 RNA-binding domain-containing protein [Phycisphaerales bacterium]
MSNADHGQPPSSLDAALEAEINAALGDGRIDDMLDDGPEVSSGTRSERTGTIVLIRGDEVLVEFGPRLTGVCARSQFKDEPAIGTTDTFTVERTDPEDGVLILSRRGAIAKARWQDIGEGQVIEAMCTGSNKGGLELDVSGHKAFMPAGQVDLRHIEDLDVFIGQKLPCEVIELDRSKGRLVLSRRKAMQALREQERGETLAALSVGDVVDGTVTSVKDFGAFVDVGGVDGLVHISDLSWERVRKVEDVVKAGDAVRVQVLGIETDRDPVRVSLGMKQLASDPFTSAATDLSEGSMVSGPVTRLEAFGAFVEVAPGVEGLVHISEMAHERVHKPSQIVKVGQVVQVQVLGVDPGQQRISLSMKRAQSSDAAASSREEDPAMRKLREKFGGQLKGGLG